MQSHDFASTYVGTPYYMSPEICAAERYTLHSDIWSLGCVMYELCAREPPFDAKTHLQLIQKIKDGRVAPLPSMYSDELQNAIKSCLKTNPLQRPDTSALLNLPFVRLMRKEREVVEVGKALRTKEEQVASRLKDLEVRAASLKTEEEKMRASVEDTVRREWEVKARLTIDKQIQLEMEALQKKYEAEVKARVQAEVRQQLHSLNLTKPTTPISPADLQLPPSDNGTKSDSSELGDLSSLSIGSLESQSSAQLPVKRKPRGPLARARTQFDTPLDVQLPAPSPMSIDCLSLSPRRTAAAAATSIPNSKNIFAAAANGKVKVNPLTLSPKSTTALDSAIMEDSDDEVPDLPSPTRRPRMPTRPGLIRQKTAPSNHTSAAPALFPSAVNKQPRIPAPTNVLPTGSPVRKAPPRPVASTGGDEMLKAVMHRNMVGTGGRTLVELAQERAGAIQNAAAAGGKGITENVEKSVAGGFRRRNSDVPVWDPEKDEMPSPFLIRGGKGLRRL